MPKTFSMYPRGAERPWREAPAWRVAAVVLAYLFVFWGVLPALLFITGMRLDSLALMVLPLEPLHKPLGVSFVLAGSIITATATAQLWLQGRGYPISHLPPTEFVARGLYRWRRHPIYIGYTALFIGVSFLYESPWSVAFSGPLLVLLWIWYARYFEEPMLIERFGDQYITYRKATPIFLPDFVGRFGRMIVRPLVQRSRPVVNWLANRTVAFRAGDYIFVTYGLFVAAGTLLSLLALGGILRPAGWDAASVGVLLVGIPVSGMLVARVFWWFAHRKETSQSPLSGVRRVGFVSWGGLLGVGLFLAFDGALARHDPLVVADGFMRVMFIGYCVGRLGCLSYGCCYGLPTSGPGVLYTSPQAKAIRERGDQGVERHATQLYSALLGALLVIFLNAIAGLQPAPGTVAALGLISYGVGRFFVEPYRDRPRFAHGVLTHGHLGCLASIIAGWILLMSISAGSAGDGPTVSLLNAFAGGLPLWPYVTVGSVAVLVVMGSHWKRIGTW